MLLVIVKEYKDGRWINFNAEKLYKIGDVITDKDGKKYEVKQVNGSKLKLEANNELD